MDRDQLGAVREGRLHLDVLDHLRDAVHHLVTGEHPSARVHDVADRLTVARRFEDVNGQQGHRLGVVQTQPPVAALAGHVGRDVDQQALLLMRSQMHDDSSLLFGWCVRPGIPKVTDNAPWMAHRRSPSISGEERREDQTAVDLHHLVNPRVGRHPTGQVG